LVVKARLGGGSLLTEALDTIFPSRLTFGSVKPSSTNPHQYAQEIGPRITEAYKVYITTPWLLPNVGLRVHFPPS
jgi:hypothetical protein